MLLLPHGDAKVIELMLATDSSRTWVRRAEVRYYAMGITRAQAWYHLVSNPPTLEYEGRRYRPAISAHLIQDVNRMWHSNPYRKAHDHIYYGWSIVAWECISLACYSTYMAAGFAALRKRLALAPSIRPALKAYSKAYSKAWRMRRASALRAIAGVMVTMGSNHDHPHDSEDVEVLEQVADYLESVKR